MKNNRRPILILVSGPSGSGKTTLSKRLANNVPKNVKVVIISQDDFYNEKKLIPKLNGIFNYDHPDAFNWKLIRKTLDRLINTDKEVTIYKYDFNISKITNEVSVIAKDVDLIIFEGLFTLYDKQIRELADLTVFVETELDECFIRRILRDIHERGRDIDNVISKWRCIVKPMYKFYIEPLKFDVDIIIPWDERKENSISLLTNWITTNAVKRNKK